jgi:hypothetical protein
MSTFIISHHSEDMAKLNNKNKLLDKNFADFEQDFLEEFVVIVEVAGKQELRLKLHPYRVTLLAAALFSREEFSLR